MKLFKRWSSGIASRIDWMVGQIENHEALVNSSIGETRRAVAKAKVQLARVREDGARLRDRLAAETEGQRKWKDRARQCANDDEERALECLQRSRIAAGKIPDLQTRLEEHARIESRLARDVQTLEENLSQLIEKRNLMRTRQSRAEALGKLHSSTATVSGDVREVLDRWEARISAAEFEGACELETDVFEEAFVTAEVKEELRRELEELKGQNGGPASHQDTCFEKGGPDD